MSESQTLISGVVAGALAGSSIFGAILTGKGKKQYDIDAAIDKRLVNHVGAIEDRCTKSV